MKDEAELKRLLRESKDRPLEASMLPDHPMAAFADWLEEALELSLPEANAMALSTVDASLQPSTRMVLLKYYDRDGLVFYTNYGSRKAEEIGANPRVSLLFYWPQLERQIRVRGEATKISAGRSLKYFASRPRDSQIGAWVSQQSSVISARSLLESKFLELKKKFEGEDVPLPSFWGGYEVKPMELELWQGRKSRLHDRFLYRREDDGAWVRERLAP